MKDFTSAIIVAAGNSTRMGLGISKQLIPINSAPAIEYTLSAFQFSHVIDEIIIVTRSADISQMEDIASRFTKVKKVVLGGDTREDSVYNGVMATSDEARFFAIHDGARILITDDDIYNVVKRARVIGAATLGVPVTDTVKVIDNENIIVSTPNRSTLWAVQTPQVFERELYLKALDHARKNKLSVTDDCSMVEAIGAKVEVVLGDYSNIKLTTQTDILLAQAVLSKRK